MNDVRVAIIGGGYAGMAAAVELARAGLALTVFEASPTLGGRARVLWQHGQRINTGAHVLLGAYSETLRLLRSLGVGPKTMYAHPFQIEVAGRLHWPMAPLPAPFHFIGGLFLAHGLTWADRRAVLRLLWQLHRMGYMFRQDCRVAQLLADTRQTPLLNELVWQPFCLWALNTPIDQASAQAFAQALRDFVLAGRSAAEWLIPRVDLSELLPVPAARYVSMQGHPVQTACTIRGIRIVDERFELEGDPSRTSYSHLILATAPAAAKDLLAGFEELQVLREQLGKLRFEPVTTVYMAYDKNIKLAAPVIQVPGSPFQYLFDRGQLGDEAGLIAAVAPNSPHIKLTQEEWMLEAHKAVEQSFPRLAPPKWSECVQEARATFPCEPSLIRPRTLTPIRKLLLAGDYLESPYPANIESAVRSGLAAARHILRTTPPAGV